MNSKGPLRRLSVWSKGARVTEHGASADVEALRAKAAEIIELLVKNDWKAVRNDFDSTMEERLSEDRLASSWASVVKTRGVYVSHGKPTQLRRRRGMVVFDTPITFGIGEMKIRVTLRPSGEVAGLFILVPETKWELVRSVLFEGLRRIRPSATADVEALRPKAAEVTDLLVRNDWKAVRKDFDSTMEKKLSEDRLASAWASVVDAKGAYVSHGKPTPVPKGRGTLVFDTPITFALGEMKSRVTLRPNGEVAGLFILVPEVS